MATRHLSTIPVPTTKKSNPMGAMGGKMIKKCDLIDFDHFFKNDLIKN